MNYLTLEQLRGLSVEALIEVLRELAEEYERETQEQIIEELKAEGVLA